MRWWIDSDYVIFRLMEKHRVTIENLAGMVQQGFEGVDKKFEDLGQRMDKGFAEVKEWQHLTDGRLDAIEMELEPIFTKILQRVAN